jgi:hypothetical protein
VLQKRVCDAQITSADHRLRTLWTTLYHAELLSFCLEVGVLAFFGVRCNLHEIQRDILCPAVVTGRSRSNYIVKSNLCSWLFRRYEPERGSLRK